MDATRAAFKADTGRDAKFVVSYLTADEGWALLVGRPIQPNGKPIDYMGTKYEQDIKDGLFDEGIIVLLKGTDKGFKVVEMAVGPTDFPAQDWILKYKAPKSLLAAVTGE